MVGAPRFELGTSSPPDWRANQAAPRPARSIVAQCPSADLWGFGHAMPDRESPRRGLVASAHKRYVEKSKTSQHDPSPSGLSSSRTPSRHTAVLCDRERLWLDAGQHGPRRTERAGVWGPTAAREG